MSERGYQHNFSDRGTAMFDKDTRVRKAVTMVSVLQEYFEDRSLSDLSLINVGGSTGIIDQYLANHFGTVVGVDIDEPAIKYALENFQQPNLDFKVGDAMNLEFEDCSVDVVVCSQVYEHVPDAKTMMGEIFRVLKPGGVCYFAAGNRLMWNEPHYNLPLLSVMPRSISHLYMRIAGKGRHYYEKHLTYWGLKSLVKEFELVDYTQLSINDPERYQIDYMIKPGSRKQALASTISRLAYWLVPGYIWLLRKPQPEIS